MLSILSAGTLTGRFIKYHLMTDINNLCPMLFKSSSRGVGWGGGNAGTSPEIGKIVGEKFCYLSGVYTFGGDAELQEIFSKKLWQKVNFFIDMFIKNIKIFFIFGLKAQDFACGCLIFPSNGTHSSNIDNISFATVFRRFSPKIPEFSSRFQ